ncbi:hypothetical protein GCM10023335_21300 [Streptomyces siamensis]|uniref:Uncharacterized protein n=1 Tax=Streptomyces siamensis TaxID=1274986 RepID=A0ABP9IP47_9ACTN
MVFGRSGEVLLERRTRGYGGRNGEQLPGACTQNPAAGRGDARALWPMRAIPRTGLPQALHLVDTLSDRPSGWPDTPSAQRSGPGAGLRGPRCAAEKIRHGGVGKPDDAAVTG